jgi:hypothetical protein
MNSATEKMFLDSVKEYLRQFPGVSYTLDPINKCFFILFTGDSELDYEIGVHIQELAEYYDCENILDDGVSISLL